MSDRSKQRVLVVEDDRLVGKAIFRELHNCGYETTWVETGDQAIRESSSGTHEAMILDLSLPDIDGMEVLNTLRRRGNIIPILIVSRRASPQDRINGLNAGADDYLAKPFDFDELRARVYALLRRQPTDDGLVLRAGNLELDVVNRTVRMRGNMVSISPREFVILEMLLREPGTIVSRRKLETAVYDSTGAVNSNVVEVHMHNLRRKLGPGFIRNIRGYGYMIDSQSG